MRFMSQVNRKYVRKGVEVKVGEQATPAKEVVGEDGPASERQQGPVGAAPNPYAIDIESMEDKPWRKPGADLSDWFNFGFNEETWQAYCMKQQQLRRMNAMQGSIQVVETERRETNIKSEDATRSESGGADGGFQIRRPESQEMRAGAKMWGGGAGAGAGGGQRDGGFNSPEEKSRDGDGERDRHLGDGRDDGGDWHERGTYCSPFWFRCIFPCQSSVSCQKNIAASFCVHYWVAMMTGR